MNAITRLLFTLVLRFQIRAFAAPGDVDPGFVPPASLITPSIALLPDGRIVLGGSDSLFPDGTLSPDFVSPTDTDAGKFRRTSVRPGR